jgi:hypothetical protein
VFTLLVLPRKLEGRGDEGWSSVLDALVAF